MDLDALLIILTIIKNNGDSNKLYKTMLTPFEIGEICSYALEKGLIINKHEKFEITKKGIEEIDRINESFKRIGIDKFIVPFSRYTIAKMSKDDIYIPENFL